MRRDKRGLDEVSADVRIKRRVRPNDIFIAQLRLWGEMRYDVWEEEEGKVPEAPSAKILEEKNLMTVCKTKA